MITVTELKVQSFSLNFLDVSWEIADLGPGVDIDDYTFVVERSESPAGPFEVVSPPLVDQYSFRDESVELREKWRIYYYRILVTDVPAGESCPSAVSYLGHEPDRVGLEMARLLQLTLRVQIGVPALVFKVRTSGPHCPECFDTRRKKRVKSDCLLCFDSTYRGGFLGAVGTFINFTPSTKTINLGGFHEMEPHTTAIDMTGYPILSPGDLIVNTLNQRFKVRQVQVRSKQGFIHRQIATVYEIPRTDRIYQFEIDPTLFPHRGGPLWPLPWQTGQIQKIVERPSSGAT